MGMSSKFTPEDRRKMENQLRTLESRLTNEKDRTKRDSRRKEIQTLKSNITGRHM